MMDTKTMELLRDIDRQQERYKREMGTLPRTAKEYEMLAIKIRGNEIIKAMIEKMHNKNKR